MRISVWMLLFCLGLVTGGLRAQTVEDAEKTLHDQLAKQRLVPRGFSADANVHYQWTASDLVMSEPKLRTFGVMEVSSIKVKHGQVEIWGKRRTLLKGKDKLGMSEETPVRLLVDLAAADPVTALPQLKNRLFYGTLDEALAAVPQDYQKMIPYDVVHSDVGSKKNEMATEACGDGAQGFKRPVVVYAAEPQFSEEARHEKFNGSVSVVITVDKTGHPVGLWLAVPTGHGLDEQAANAVRQYVFKPATCSGTPVPVTLAIDVKFAIF